MSNRESVLKDVALTLKEATLIRDSLIRCGNYTDILREKMEGVIQLIEQGDDENVPPRLSKAGARLLSKSRR
jgi:hypothetical protein